MKRTIELWHHAFSEENIKPCKDGVIISMQGFGRFEDFYLCIPKRGFYYRSANEDRYGYFCYEYFYNGEFLGGGRIDKMERIKRLCESGESYEAYQYIHGYMLWRETSLGGKRIIRNKEIARLSHAICDENGKGGHDARQIIRRQLKYGAMV